MRQKTLSNLLSISCQLANGYTIVNVSDNDLNIQYNSIEFTLPSNKDMVISVDYDGKKYVPNKDSDIKLNAIYNLLGTNNIIIYGTKEASNAYYPKILYATDNSVNLGFIN